MVTTRRLLVYLLVGYTILEISVDNVLVFMDLTGRSVPSFTLLLFGLIGLDLRPTAGAAGAPTVVFLVLGVLGLAFMLAAVWQVVAR